MRFERAIEELRESRIESTRFEISVKKEKERKRR